MHKKFYISLFVSLSLVLCLAQTSYAYNIGKVPNTNKLPLIETALGGDALPGQMYVVPAIFLKYNTDKIRNDYIEKGIVTTLDVATIALSGGTALATKVHWVRRAWALAEVAGAVGNIAVNTQAISSPRVKEAVDIYNAAMGLIGLKNIGQGGYKFIKNLPEQTKKLLQKSERLREGLQQGYLKWKALAKNLDNLTDAERQLITEQEQVWRVLGMLDDIKGVNNLSILKTLKGIIPTGNKLTNIRYSDFVKGFDADFIINLGEKYAEDLNKIRNGLDKGGDLTEGIVSEALRQQGYTVTKNIGKYGSNNGFDVVAYKGTLDYPTEIMIIEAKQFKQDKILDEFNEIKEIQCYHEPSGLILNPANPETGLPTQMSKEWTFRHVAGKLNSKGGVSRKISIALENDNIVERYVFAIEKNDGAGYFVKLSNDF